MEKEPFTHTLSHCLPPALINSAQPPSWKACLALICLPDGRTWLPFCTFLSRWFHLNCLPPPPAFTAVRLEETGQTEQSCTLSFSPTWKIQYLLCVRDMLGYDVKLLFKCTILFSKKMQLALGKK